MNILFLPPFICAALLYDMLFQINSNFVSESFKSGFRDCYCERYAQEFVTSKCYETNKLLNGYVLIIYRSA